jgi:hypothetical protein
MLLSSDTWLSCCGHLYIWYFSFVILIINFKTITVPWNIASTIIEYVSIQLRHDRFSTHTLTVPCYVCFSSWRTFTYSIIVEAIFHGTVIVLKLIIKIDKSWWFHESLLDLDFVCLYNYEFWLSLWKIVWSSVILSLPLSRE